MFVIGLEPVSPIGESNYARVNFCSMDQRRRTRAIHQRPPRLTTISTETDPASRPQVEQ
jgi:hypothetical protein